MNLQLDHFPMITPKKHIQLGETYVYICRPFPHTQQSFVLKICSKKKADRRYNAPPIQKQKCPFIQKIYGVSVFGGVGACVDNGSHNVSRWMTWLPISLKNAVKCDKWYQLQNHSITESLNANGAWEKLYCVIPVHAIFSVSNKKQHAASSLLHIYILYHTQYIYNYVLEAKRRRVFVLCAYYMYICCVHT